MKGARPARAVQILIYACVFLLGYFALSAIGSIFFAKPAESSAGNAGPDPYEIRSRLLMEAAGSVGVCAPQDAAHVWAEGLRERSAALQYAVMTKALQDEYAAQLETTFPNWVTGVSSPWIEQYNLLDEQQTDDNTYRFVIRFDTETSSGPAGNFDATLTVVKDGEFWRVSKVATDEELRMYTGFEQ